MSLTSVMKLFFDLLFKQANETRTCNVECAPDGSNSLEQNKEWEDDFRVDV